MSARAVLGDRARIEIRFARILTVDDEPNRRRILGVLPRVDRHVVTEAAGAREAIAAIGVISAARAGHVPLLAQLFCGLRRSRRRAAAARLPTRASRRDPMADAGRATH